MKKWLSELAKTPSGKAALESFLSSMPLASAYNPVARPLPGVVYEPYYIAYVKGCIQGHNIDCLIDTGATIFVLTVEAVLRMDLQDAVQPTNKCLSVSAHSVHSQGELPQLPVVIRGIECRVNFYIGPQGGYELLLGMDVLMARRAVIDLHDKTLRLAREIPVPGDDYVSCKKIPMEVRIAEKAPLHFFRNVTSRRRRCGWIFRVFHCL